MTWADFKHFFGCRPAGPVGFDGCSLTAVCAHCRCPILQDSNGGWFPAGDPIPASETRES